MPKVKKSVRHCVRFTMEESPAWKMIDSGLPCKIGLPVVPDVPDVPVVSDAPDVPVVPGAPDIPGEVDKAPNKGFKV